MGISPASVHCHFSLIGYVHIQSHLHVYARVEGQRLMAQCLHLSFPILFFVTKFLIKIGVGAHRLLD